MFSQGVGRRRKKMGSDQPLRFLYGHARALNWVELVVQRP